MHSARLLAQYSGVIFWFSSQESGQKGGKTTAPPYHTHIHTEECFVSTFQLLEREMGLFPCLQGNPAILYQSVITDLC